jgi:hypothetical protein
MELGRRQLEDWCDAYNELMRHSEAPDVYHEWSALYALCCAVGRNICWRFGHITVWLNLFVILVGPPGRTRKSDSISMAHKLVGSLPATYISTNQITAAALVNQLLASHQLSQSVPVPGMPQREPSAAVHAFVPELGPFLRENDRELMTIIADLYDCRDDFAKETVYAGRVDIDNVMLSILGATTPDALGQIITNFSVGQGLMSRVMLVCAEHPRHKISLVKLPKLDATLIRKLEHDLALINLVQGTPKLTPEAAEWFDQWYQGLDDVRDAPGRDPRFRSYVSRKPAYVLKVAALKQLARSSNLTVGLPTLRRAVELIDRTEQTMTVALQSVGNNPFLQGIKTIGGLLRSYGSCSLSMLMRAVSHDLTHAQVEDVLRSMLDSKLIAADFSEPADEPRYRWIGN